MRAFNLQAALSRAIKTMEAAEKARAAEKSRADEKARADDKARTDEKARADDKARADEKARAVHSISGTVESISLEMVRWLQLQLLESKRHY
jgi:hypothetical protein